MTADDATGAGIESGFGARSGWLGLGRDAEPRIRSDNGSDRGSDAATDALDSLLMEARDRLTNLGFFAGAGVVWILVALVLTSRDPRVDAAAGFVGALLIGLAIGLT